MCHLPVSTLTVALEDYSVYCPCSSVCAHESGRVCLGRVDVVEHHYGSAVVVQHQPPEVLHRVRQRVLGHDESGGLLVALERKREEIRGKRKRASQ